MAVKLKLTRLGSKKHPFYRVVAATDETRRDGRPLEFLGYYNPMKDPIEVKLDADKIKEWLARGAEPTEEDAKLFENVQVPIVVSTSEYNMVKAETLSLTLRAAEQPTGHPATDSFDGETLELGITRA